MGLLPPWSVPVTMGFCGSSESGRVDRVTVPVNAWFRETLSVPALASVPFVGRVTVPGGLSEKSGMAIVDPG